MTRVRLIIFDLGGVLVRLERHKLLEAVARETKRPLEDLEQLVVHSHLIEQFELGRIGPTQFFVQLKESLKLSWTFDRFVTAWNSILSENPETTWMLQRLRERYTLLALSNTDVLHDEYIRRTWPVFGQMHHWIASYQVGLRKPEPQIYELALRRAEASPHAAVYIDDTEECVETARALGLIAIHCAPGLPLEQELRAAGVHV